MNCSKDCKQLLGLCIYIKIVLIQYPLVWTGAVLLDIPDYQTTYTDLSSYGYCFVTALVHGVLIRGVCHMDISFICCSESSGSSSMFTGVFIAQVDRLGDTGSGDNTVVDCRTDSLGGFSERVPEICLFHW